MNLSLFQKPIITNNIIIFKKMVLFDWKTRQKTTDFDI